MWSHEQTVPVIQRGLGSGVSLGPSWLVCAREPSKTQEEHADSTHTHKPLVARDSNPGPEWVAGWSRSVDMKEQLEALLQRHEL